MLLRISAGAVCRVGCCASRGGESYAGGWNGNIHYQISAHPLSSSDTHHNKLFRADTSYREFPELYNGRAGGLEHLT